MTPTKHAATRTELVEERDYLLRSIEDLEREYAAGDVGDSDYKQLRSSYVQRAAATLRLLETLPDTGIETESSDNQLSTCQRFRHWLGRRKVRRVLIVVALVCLIAALTLFAAGLSGVRLPGQTSSGSINLPSSTQVRDDLVNAQVLATSGNLSAAIAEYNAVLTQVPQQPQALAYRGWLERLAGIAKNAPVAVRVGDASIAQAIHDDPSYSDARAFEVIVLFEDDHAPTEAGKEYAAFVGTKPSKSLVSAIGPQMALAFTNAKVAVPVLLRPYR